METFSISSITQLINELSTHLYVILYFIGLLWAIHIVNYFLGMRLSILGIIPRNPYTLLGIFFSPFLHGDFNHLFFNSIPLFVLGSFVLLQGVMAFYCVTAFIIIVSGLLLWCFGRKGLHIGASGLIMGYWAYLLAYAYLTGTFVSVIPAILTIYYFGGMFFSIFPGQKKLVSWEGHLFGGAAGVLAALALPYIYPLFNSGVLH